jgi:zinc transport system substrate-binding protein
MKIIKKIGAAALATFMALGLLSCGQEPKEKDGMTFYTSFYPMYYFTKTLVGDKAEVINLMPPGADSHDFEPSADQIRKLVDADAFIYQGAGMEFWVDKVEDTLEKEGAKTKFIEAADDIELLPAGAHHHHDEEDHDDHDHDEHDHEEHDHGQYDPHLWLSLRKSSQMLDNIYEGLVEVDGKNQATYKENLDKAKADLDKLDKEFAKKIQASELEYFIINHEAFQYLAQDYGLTQIGISGVGTEQDPSPALLGSLVDLAKMHNINTIYYDSSGSDKVSQALAKEIGAKVLPLTTIHAPSKEEMDKGIDYLELMRQNLSNLLESAPNP